MKTILVLLVLGLAAASAMADQPFNSKKYGDMTPEEKAESMSRLRSVGVQATSMALTQSDGYKISMTEYNAVHNQTFDDLMDQLQAKWQASHTKSKYRHGAWWTR